MKEPPAGWRPEMGYIDPFPGDEPQFKITRENWATHKEQLGPTVMDFYTVMRTVWLGN